MEGFGQGHIGVMLGRCGAYIGSAQVFYRV